MGLMDLFYGQSDEALYTTPKPAHENAAIRQLLFSSRKAKRRVHPFGDACGSSYDEEQVDIWRELDGYTRHPKAYLSGHASGDETLRDLKGSQVHCDSLGTECSGITCELQPSCTVRSDCTLHESP